MKEKVLVTFHVPGSDFDRSKFTEAAIIREPSPLYPYAVVTEPMLYEIGDFEDASCETTIIEDLLGNPCLVNICFLERE